jgi:hypothetical protein
MAYPGGQADGHASQGLPLRDLGSFVFTASIDEQDLKGLLTSEHTSEIGDMSQTSYLCLVSLETDLNYNQSGLQSQFYPFLCKSLWRGQTV